MFNSINQWMWDADEDLPWRPKPLVPVERPKFDWGHFAEMVAWVLLLIASWGGIVAAAVILK